MEENQFIKEIKKINTIIDYEEKIESCREFLINNCNEKVCSKKYLNGIEIFDEIDLFYSVKISKTEDVYVSNIYGTKHFNYINISPYDFVKQYGKRIPVNLTSLCFYPENYFTGELNIACAFSYNDLTSKRKHIITEANHRFSISKVIDSFVENDLFIKDVRVQHYILDWELKDLINNAKDILNTNGFDLILSPYANREVVDETYNIFTWIKIQKINSSDCLLHEIFMLDENNLKESEELNRLRVKDICKNIELYIKKYNSFFSRFKRIFL